LPAIGSPGNEIVAAVVSDGKNKKGSKAKGEKPEWAQVSNNCSLCGIRSCQGTELVAKALKGGVTKTAEECCLAFNDAPLDSFSPMTRRYILLIRQYRHLFPKNPLKNCVLSVRDVTEKIQSMGAKAPELDAAVNLLGILGNDEIQDPEATFAWLTEQGMDLGAADFILTVGADTVLDIGTGPSSGLQNVDATQAALDQMTVAARRYQNELSQAKQELRVAREGAAKQLTDSLTLSSPTRTSSGSKLATNNEALQQLDSYMSPIPAPSFSTLTNASRRSPETKEWNEEMSQPFTPVERILFDLETAKRVSRHSQSTQPVLFRLLVTRILDLLKNMTQFVRSVQLSRAITAALMVYTFRATITPAIHTLLVTTVRTIFQVVTATRAKLGSVFDAKLMTLPMLLGQLVGNRLPTLTDASGALPLVSAISQPAGVTTLPVYVPALPALPMTDPRLLSPELASANLVRRDTIGHDARKQ